MSTGKLLFILISISEHLIFIALMFSIFSISLSLSLKHFLKYLSFVLPNCSNPNNLYFIATPEELPTKFSSVKHGTFENSCISSFKDFFNTSTWSSLRDLTNHLASPPSSSSIIFSSLRSLTVSDTSLFVSPKLCPTTIKNASTNCSLSLTLSDCNLLYASIKGITPSKSPLAFLLFWYSITGTPLKKCSSKSFSTTVESSVCNDVISYINFSVSVYTSTV